ncbi:phasin family protein [Natroniella sp. ANB-PHB2]|uniref:phasin family protein n=1 Tax=Natroniella sp. ANB-PHB2 TaxID=3384444 RepID=UPI0038D4F069
MIKLFKETMVTGLGALLFTKEKLEDMVQELIEEGAVNREEAEQLVDEMIDKAQQQKKEMREKISLEVEKKLAKSGFAKKRELERLRRKVEQLELHIQSLEEEFKATNSTETKSIEAIDDN